jgi:rubrerythrin
MPKKKAKETSAKFLSTIKQWQKLEDDTIRFSEEMLKKSKNSLVRITMEIIRDDSKKHKALQQMLIDSLTKEALHLSPDELAGLSNSLNKHVAAEAKSLEFADEALRNSNLFSTRYILSVLIADEAKHHKLLSNLNDVKRATVMVT